MAAKRKRDLAIGVVAAMLAVGPASTQPATGIAWAAGQVDVYNGGDLHESVGQADQKDFTRGVTYEARTFPIAIRIRPPDSLWGGVQLHSGRFGFVQLLHRKAGSTPLNGRGNITFETASGRTPSVAATLRNLLSTPQIDAGRVTAVRVGGFSGKSFDATITGTDRLPPDPPGISLAPFTTNRHCGFCTKTMNGETLDHKWARKGQLFRIMVLGVRGRTVVVYLESTYNDSTTRKYPPDKTFPTFLPYAQKLLANVTFPG